MAGSSRHRSPWVHVLCCLLLVAGSVQAVSATAAPEAPSAVGSAQTQPGLVVHVDTDAQMNLVLRQIRNQTVAMPDLPVQVVMIGGAVHALVEGATDDNGGLFSAQIEQLLAVGVRVFACGNTLMAFGLTQDDLTFGVEVVPVGVAAITRLQLEQGFAYIKL